MRASRFEQIYSGLTDVAKKVYTATTLNEEWAISAINGEMRRKGQSIDRSVTAGCLVSLKSQGLVKEPLPGHFIRVAIKHPTANDSEFSPEPKATANTKVEFTQTNQEEAPEKEQSKMTQQSADKKPSNLNPIDRLEMISVRVTEMMESLKKLADDIDEAALDMTAQLEAKEAELVKFRQLQALLKGIA